MLLNLRISDREYEKFKALQSSKAHSVHSVKLNMNIFN